MKIQEPCPFCKERRDLHPVELAVLPAGDEPRAYASDFFVGCAKCGALGPPAGSETEAVEYWNRRPEP